MSAPLLSRAIDRVLQIMAVNPGRPFFQRELSRLTGERYNGVVQALTRLVREGVVQTASVGGKPAFLVNAGNPYFEDFQRIAVKSLGIPETLDAAGVLAHVVVVFGSYAKGVVAEGSDVDVLVVGRESRLGAATGALRPIAERIGRPINVVVYDHARYRRERDEPASFIAAIANGPTIKLRGAL